MPAKLQLVQPPKRCEKQHQVIECSCGSRDMVEVRAGAMRRDGKVTGGTKQWLCAHCLMQGKRVLLAT